MSNKYLNLAFKMPTNVHENAILVALADASDGDGFCFPGYKDLMEKTKMSKSALAKHLSILEGAGFFEKKAHSHIGNGRKANTYQLLFNETWFELIPQNGSKSPRLQLIESTRLLLIEKINELRKGKKRTISSHLVPRKVAASYPISSPLEHEPSYNHHIEPSLNKYKGEKQAEKVNEKQPAKPAKKTTIPDDFAVSAGVLSWYQEKGYTEDISKHLENFKDQCQAKGYEYANFDAAFRTAIQKDWAALRNSKISVSNHSRGISRDEWNSTDF